MFLSVVVTDHHVHFPHNPKQEKSDSFILLIYDIALIFIYRLLPIVSSICLSNIFQEHVDFN